MFADVVDQGAYNQPLAFKTDVLFPNTHTRAKRQQAKCVADALNEHHALLLLRQAFLKTIWLGQNSYEDEAKNAAEILQYAPKGMQRTSKTSLDVE